MKLAKLFLIGVLGLGLSSCSMPSETSLPNSTSLSSTKSSATYAGFTGALSAQTMSGSKVQLTWSPATDPNVVAYNIYDATFTFAPKLIKTVAAPASTASLTGLTPESLYAFRVRAANSQDVEDGNTNDIKAIPYAGVLTAQVQTSTSAIIPFSDGSNADEVDILCQVGGSTTWTTLARVTNTNLTQATLTGLTSGTQYICKADLIISGFTDNNTVTTQFTPIGVATQLVFTTQPGSALAGSSLGPQPVVTVKDVNGNTVTSGPDSNVVITLAVVGAGNLVGTYSVPAINGVATFGVAPNTPLSVDQAGLWTLSASKPSTLADPSGFGSPAMLTSAGGTPYGFNSQSFTISPGAVSSSQSSITVSPAGPLIANGASSYTVTVTLADMYGNPVPNVTPTFASNNNNDILGQPISPTNASGQATGSISTNVVGGVMNNGVRSLSITSPSGLTSDTALVTFIPGAASQLAFTAQPQSSPAGAGGMTSNIVVTIEDASGNQVAATDQTASTSVDVALSYNPGAGTLSGNTQVSAILGVATFTGLGINNIGNGYKMKAYAPSFLTLIQPNSNPFNITAASPVKIAFTSGSSSLTSSTSGQTASVCGTYNLQLQDGGGNSSNATVTTTVPLSSTKSTGGAGGALFYNSSNCSGSAVTSISINQGHATATISARDTNAETAILTASPTGLTAGTFNVAVAPSQFTLSGGPTSLLTSTACSSAFVVSTQGASGVNGPVPSSTSFAFTFLNSGASTNASAYSDPACSVPLGASPATMTIAAGASSGTIYFADQSADAPITVALAPQNGMLNATSNPSSQTVSFLPSKIIVTSPSPLNVAAGGPCVGPFLIQVEDSTNNTSSTSNTLNFNGGSGTSAFYSSNACSSPVTTITTTSGQAQFWFADTAVENLTISVSDPTPAPLKMTPSAGVNINVWPYQLAWSVPATSTASIQTGPLPNATPNSVICLPMTVQTQYSNGTPIAPLTPVTVSLVGAGAQSATGASYYADNACTQAISSGTINGTNSTNVYFMTMSPGTFSLTTADAAAILQTSGTAGTIAVTATAEPAWIGTRNNVLAGNSTMTFTTPVKPVAPKFDGPQAVRALMFASDSINTSDTDLYLYALDNARGGIYKYDYTQGTYIGWIGGVNSSNGAPTGGASGCLSLTNNNMITPSWCTGGTPNINWQTSFGDMTYSTAMTNDGYNLYVASGVWGQSVAMYNLTTGAFEGWIGMVSATATGGPTGTTPSNISAGMVANSSYPSGVALSNTCSTTAVGSPTPGFCAGGVNQQNVAETALGDGHMQSPVALAYSQGVLYVANSGADTVAAYDASGTNTHGKFLGFIGVVNSTTGMTCSGGSPVTTHMTPGWCKGGTYYNNNTGGYNWAPTGNTNAGIYNPSGIYVDAAGTYLYVVSNNGTSSRVSRFLRSTGALDSVRIQTSLLNPQAGIATDGNYIYMAEMQRMTKLDITMNNFLGWIGKINSPPTAPAACAGLNPYSQTPGWCSNGSSISGIDEQSFNETTAVAYDGLGYFVTGSANDFPAIKKWNASTGAYIGSLASASTSPTQWVTTADQATLYGFDDSSMFSPASSFVDSVHKIMYLVETGNARVKEISTATGQVLGWIGGIETTPTGGASTACTQTGIGLMQGSPGWCLGMYPNPAYLNTNGLSPININPLTPGVFFNPSGIASDNTYLYVTDPGTWANGNSPHRISRFKISDGSYQGWIGWIGSSVTGMTCTGGTPVVNTFTPGWCTNGPSTSSQYDGGLNRPVGITYDSGTQNLYVVDYYNSRVSNYSASSGSFNGWIGQMSGTNPPSCATVNNGGTNYTSTWCKGSGGAAGSALSAVSIVNGDPGGGFAWGAFSNWNYNVGITNDGTYLYVPDPYNNRINRFYLQAGSGHLAGGFKDMLNTSYTTTANWTTTAGAWGNPGPAGSNNAPTNIYPEGVYVDGTNLYYTVAASSAVVKRLLSNGSLIGWHGGVGTTPSSCTGTGSDTYITPGWCTGGSPKVGTVFGFFNGGNSYISGDNYFLYVSDSNTHRVTRIPKNP